MPRSTRKQDRRGLRAGKAGPGGPEEQRRLDLRILESIRRVSRAIDLHSQKLSAEYSVTGPQLLCLTALAEEEPLGNAELARRLHLSASTLVGIVDRLERKKLVTRLRDEVDRRFVRVSLTEEGRNLVASAPSPLRRRVAEGLEKLSERQQKQIAQSLDLLVDMLEARNADAAPMLESGTREPRRRGRRSRRE